MQVKADLSIATYNFRDPKEAELFQAQDLNRIKRTVGNKLRDLQAKGIIDQDGHPVRTDTPPDMQPNSGADVG